MNKTFFILAIVSTILSLGCGTIHRLDGGRSAEFVSITPNQPPLPDGLEANTGGGTEIIIGAFQVGGSAFSVWPFQKRTGLVRTFDDPSISAGNSIASKAAANAMNGQVIHTNGNKIVIFGAQGLKIEAQDLKGILEEFNKLTPAGQVSTILPDGTQAE